MIILEDRQALAQDIETACTAFARLAQACDTAGIDAHTLQRWKARHGLVRGDGRPGAVRPILGHALSEVERRRLVQVANEPRFADVPPARIVPMLADEGIYLASESTFARVPRAEGQNAHRGRAKAHKAVRPPTTHVANAPRQVWCWDMTYLAGSRQVTGKVCAQLADFTNARRAAFWVTTLSGFPWAPFFHWFCHFDFFLFTQLQLKRSGTSMTSPSVASCMLVRIFWQPLARARKAASSRRFAAVSNGPVSEEGGPKYWRRVL
jgi:hypothetical protein